MPQELNVGIIGYKFMGKAHSNAWVNAPLFFDMPLKPVLKVACGRQKDALDEFANKWGWQKTETDWKKIVSRPDVDVIDIAVPQNLHYEIAIAAAKEGKHIFCEKPLAMNSKQAEEMLRVCEDNKVIHYLNHNYRRTPAIALAKQLMAEGRVGQIYHWRCAYQQDWIINPDFPLTWQLRKEIAEAGPQWDLNSHCVDLAHHLVGDINTVTALTTNFIIERPLTDDATTGNLKATASSEEKGKVTVEDAALMLVNFANGAVGSFEATRFAAGKKNGLTFEIYGSKGSISFDLEKLNELQFLSLDDPEYLQGFKTILVTDEAHPYIKNWWPPGHIIGYEHAFVHAAADFIHAVYSNERIEPDFRDGLKIIKVLEAGIRSAKEKRQIEVA